MAKHLDKFTKPFRDSHIPFLLAEVLTDGGGSMVDLVCRFVNGPAAELTGHTAADLMGQRFTRLFPRERLADLTPIQSVAFSGSAASFSYTTLLGQELSITCYQPMYGVAACILEPRHTAPQAPGELLAEVFPGASVVLKLSRRGARCVSFHPHLCDLTGWSRKELLDQTAPGFSALVEPGDWPGVLQELLDAAREGRTACRQFRLRQKGGGLLWVELRAKPLSTQSGTTTFYMLLQDIHQQQGTQRQLAETLSQLETARDQSDRLFASMPGLHCLFWMPEGSETAESVQVSPDLADLLGYSRRELVRWLTADPLWRVLAADRPGLEEAAAQARQAGTPLRQAFRVRQKGGGQRWLSAEIVWQPQPGGAWVCAACTDITAERDAQAALRVQSQLRDLLLDRTRTVTFDYDPAADLAQVEVFDAAEHRNSRTIPNYLDSLADAPAIHPDDRKRVAAAVRRASTRPDAEPLEFRGDYDGQGWRWYQVSWASLFDGKGDIYRLVGMAKDISVQRAAAQRYLDLSARHKKSTRGFLATFRLDLTEDRILDIKGPNRHLTRVIFGNTAEACLRHLRDSIPDPEQRAGFHALFQPAVLLDSFRQGNAHFGLEHQLTVENSGVLWVRSMVEVAENPQTRHVEAFCRIANVDGDRQKTGALEVLARLDYDFVLTVNSTTGTCHAWGGEALPEGTTYRALAARYLWKQAPSHQRMVLRRESRLENLVSRLAEQPAYAYTYTLETAGGPRAKYLRCAWLDREAGTLLITLGDAR